MRSRRRFMDKIRHRYNSDYMEYYPVHQDQIDLIEQRYIAMKGVVRFRENVIEGWFIYDKEIRKYVEVQLVLGGNIFDRAIEIADRLNGEHEMYTEALADYMAR